MPVLMIVFDPVQILMHDKADRDDGVLITGRVIVLKLRGSARQIAYTASDAR
jgi:hypothetical protein